MADILQYELFSTCKRLCAEPIVDARTAKNVVFRLCDLAENSPFPSQRARVLKYLHALVHTPHSADLARTALISLLTHDTLADTHTRIQLILTLYATSSTASNERHLAQQAFVRLVQRPDFAFEQVIKAAQTLSEDDSRTAEALQQVTQLVLDVAEQSNLTIAQLLDAFWMLSDNRLSPPKIRKKVNSILFALAQRATTSRENAINIAEILYLYMATTILEADDANYWEKAEAVRMIGTMLPTEVARAYLKESWRPTHQEANTFHKPYIEELAGEETLPVAVRDEMYMLLRKFKLNELASSHALYTDFL